jgi:protein-L-isoaspartate O-methyltransferase
MERVSGTDVVSRARSEGWRKAWFEFNARSAHLGLPLPEDERAADWAFHLDVEKRSSVLVLGCEWGTAAAALGRRAGRVVIVDEDSQRSRFVGERIAQTGADNVTLSIGAKPQDIEPAVFDLVVVRGLSDGWPVDLETLIVCLKRCLKPGGVVFFGVTNLLSPLALLPGREAGPRPQGTLRGCRRLLGREGFLEVRSFAPLPRHWGIPLFSIPLDQPFVLPYFFDRLFPLFDAVSPEVRRGFALEHALARVASLTSRVPGLAMLLAHFLPGYHLTARFGRGPHAP